MALRKAGPSLWVDDSMEDGYVLTGPCAERPSSRKRVDFHMNSDTHAALWVSGCLADVYAVLKPRPFGLHLIPASVLRHEEAEELQRGLALADPEPSSHCAFPPCILPTAVVHPDGFSLCAEHAALMQDWDDLVA